MLSYRLSSCYIEIKAIEIFTSKTIGSSQIFLKSKSILYLLKKYITRLLMIYKIVQSDHYVGSYAYMNIIL